MFGVHKSMPRGLSSVRNFNFPITIFILLKGNLLFCPQISRQVYSARQASPFTVALFTLSLVSSNKP